MERIPSLTRDPNIKKLSIFLIIVALIAGTVGCFQLSPFYQLTITNTTGGSVTTPGEGTFTYVKGEMVNLVAEAEEDYRFVNWTGDVNTITNVNAAITTINITGNYAIMANFEEIPEYDLTISSTEGGSVITPGEGTFIYDEGTVVDLLSEAEDGYHFANWTGDVGTINNITAAITTITMGGNYSILSNFVAVYNLNTSSITGGSITTPGEGTFTYDEGTVVGLVATPNDGYRFVSWTGSVGTIANVNAATTTITMSGNYSITANFEEIPEYDLTISSTEGGSVTTPDEGTFTYDEGTVVNLVAEAEGGYHFVNWIGDVSTIANVNSATTTITMNDNYTVTANFSFS